MIFLDPVGDLLVTADDGSSGVPADQAKACPEVRVNLQIVCSAAVQGGHPLLPDGRRAAEAFLCDGDREPVDRLQHPRGLCPRLFLGVTGHDVDTKAILNRAPAPLGAFAYLADPLGEGWRWLGPGQIDIRMLCRGFDGWLGGTAKEDLGHRIWGSTNSRAHHVVVLAREAEWLAGPCSA